MPEISATARLDTLASITKGVSTDVTSSLAIADVPKAGPVGTTVTALTALAGSARSGASMVRASAVGLGLTDSGGQARRANDELMRAAKSLEGTASLIGRTGAISQDHANQIGSAFGILRTASNRLDYASSGAAMHLSTDLSRVQQLPDPTSTKPDASPL